MNLVLIDSILHMTKACLDRALRILPMMVVQVVASGGCIQVDGTVHVLVLEVLGGRQILLWQMLAWHVCVVGRVTAGCESLDLSSLLHGLLLQVSNLVNAL